MAERGRCENIDMATQQSPLRRFFCFPLEWGWGFIHYWDNLVFAKIPKAVWIWSTFPLQWEHVGRVNSGDCGWVCVGPSLWFRLGWMSEQLLKTFKVSGTLVSPLWSCLLASWVHLSSSVCLFLTAISGGDASIDPQQHQASEAKKPLKYTKHNESGPNIKGHLEFV